MKTYVYTGPGLGVPGLPNRVTEQEAQQLGVADTLAECIAAGTFVEAGQAAPVARPLAPRRSRHKSPVEPEEQDTPPADEGEKENES